MFRGNVVRGNFVRGNIVRVNIVRGNSIKGNVIRGKGIKGNGVIGKGIRGTDIVPPENRQVPSGIGPLEEASTRQGGRGRSWLQLTELPETTIAAEERKVRPSVDQTFTNWSHQFDIVVAQFMFSKIL
jgi:hypothetical protein